MSCLTHPDIYFEFYFVYRHRFQCSIQGRQLKAQKREKGKEKCSTSIIFMNMDTFDTVTPLTLISTTAPAELVVRGEK